MNNTEFSIQYLLNNDEIINAFEVFSELRLSFNKENFVKQILQQQKEGYSIIAILEKNEISACLGFRIMTTLAWGKILYIDDLITRKSHRKKGYGKILLNHVTDVAKKNKCNQIHLDTGFTRYNAHRVYLNNGFEFNCHHLAKLL